MGTTHVTVTIRNLADPTRSWDGLFLVDTGAMDSLVPRSCIEAIGLEPEGQRVYETADGREIRMDFARAYIEFIGDVTAGRIIIGDAGVEPLLGVTAPESTGIEVDPVNQLLKRLPALRLKRMARGSSLGTRARCPYSLGRTVPPLRPARPPAPSPSASYSSRSV